MRGQTRENVFSIGDDFWIQAPGGERAFGVSGKVLRLRDTHGAEMAPGEGAALIPAGAVCIDRMSHD